MKKRSVHFSRILSLFLFGCTPLLASQDTSHDTLQRLKEKAVAWGKASASIAISAGLPYFFARTVAPHMERLGVNLVRIVNTSHHLQTNKRFFGISDAHFYTKDLKSVNRKVTIINMISVLICLSLTTYLGNLIQEKLLKLKNPLWSSRKKRVLLFIIRYLSTEFGYGKGIAYRITKHPAGRNIYTGYNG